MNEREQRQKATALVVLLHSKNKWPVLGLVAAKEAEIPFLLLQKSNTADSCSAEQQKVSLFW